MEKRIFLFPHTNIMADKAKMIPSSFMPITICKPWYMEIREEEEDFEILFPANELKPPNEFLKLLKEYKLWMRGQAKGNALFMIMEKEIWNSDESLRRIKTIIKDGNIEGDIDKRLEMAMKWHLILHLASEFEQSHYDIDSKIKDLGQDISPLNGAIEGKTISMDSMFKDMPSSDTYPELDEKVLKEIIMAWIGLFKGYVSDKSLFLTFNKDVFDLIKGVFEDVIMKNISKKEELPVREEILGKMHLYEISFPMLIEKKGHIEDFISNKRLIYMTKISDAG